MINALMVIKLCGLKKIIDLCPSSLFVIGKMSRYSTLSVVSDRKLYFVSTLMCQKKKNPSTFQKNWEKQKFEKTEIFVQNRISSMSIF